MRDHFEDFRNVLGQHTRVWVFFAPFLWTALAFPAWIDYMIVKYG